MRHTRTLALGAVIALAVVGLNPALGASAAPSAPQPVTSTAVSTPADQGPIDGGNDEGAPTSALQPVTGQSSTTPSPTPFTPAPTAPPTAPAPSPDDPPVSEPTPALPPVDEPVDEPADEPVDQRPTLPTGTPSPAATPRPAQASRAAFVPLSITSHAARDVYVTGLTTLAGTATPGGRVVATNQWGTTMGSAIADESGSWSFLRNLGPTTPSYVLTFVQTAENRSDTRQIELVYVPTNQPVTVTSHTDGDVYDVGTNTFTGTGTIGATVKATNQWGTAMGTAAIGASGTWAFSRYLGPADPGYVITFTSTRGAEVRSATLTLRFPQLVPVTVVSPDISAGTIDRADEMVTFTGTGTPFATLTGINQWGTPFGETKVDKNGHWEFRRWIAAGTHYAVTFTQTDAAGKTLVSSPFSFTSPTP